MLIRQVAALWHVKKIKTLITYLCSQIISDSVAVEIFAIGQPAREKYSAKYDVLLF